MQVFLGIILITCLVEVGMSLFLQYRIGWVSKVCRDAIEKDVDRYRRFPSYKYMVYHKFWVFDSKKFLDVNEN